MDANPQIYQRNASLADRITRVGANVTKNRITTLRNCSQQKKNFRTISASNTGTGLASSIYWSDKTYWSFTTAWIWWKNHLHLNECINKWNFRISDLKFFHENHEKRLRPQRTTLSYGFWFGRIQSNLFSKIRLVVQLLCTP